MNKEDLEDFLRATHADQGGGATFEEWLAADWAPEDYGFEEVMAYRALP